MAGVVDLAGRAVGPAAEPVVGAVPLLAVVPVMSVPALAAVAGAVAGALAGPELSAAVGAASGALLVVGVVGDSVELAGGKGWAVAVLPALGDEPPQAPSNPHAPSDIVSATAVDTTLTCTLR